MSFITETAIKLISKFGRVHQLCKFIEEAGELQAIAFKNINKEEITPADRKNITEEIADVYFMLEQIKVIFSISDIEINAALSYKVCRARGLVEKVEPPDLTHIECFDLFRNRFKGETDMQFREAIKEWKKKQEGTVKVLDKTEKPNVKP